MLVRKQTITNRYKEEGKRRNILKAAKEYLKYCKEGRGGQFPAC